MKFKITLLLAIISFSIYAQTPVDKLEQTAKEKKENDIFFNKIRPLERELATKAAGVNDKMRTITARTANTKEELRAFISKNLRVRDYINSKLISYTCGKIETLRKSINKYDISNDYCKRYMNPFERISNNIEWANKKIIELDKVKEKKVIKAKLVAVTPTETKVTKNKAAHLAKRKIEKEEEITNKENEKKDGEIDYDKYLTIKEVKNLKPGTKLIIEKDYQEEKEKHTFKSIDEENLFIKTTTIYKNHYERSDYTITYRFNKSENDSIFKQMWGELKIKLAKPNN